MQQRWRAPLQRIFLQGGIGVVTGFVGFSHRLIRRRQAKTAHLNALVSSAFAKPRHHRLADIRHGGHEQGRPGTRGGQHDNKQLPPLSTAPNCQSLLGCTRSP